MYIVNNYESAIFLYGPIKAYQHCGQLPWEGQIFKGQNLKGFFPLNQGPMVYTEKDHFNYFHTVGLACD